MAEQPIPGVDLWPALASELKLPLIQIARAAELAEMGKPAAQLDTIETTATNALRLIDGYLLATALGQQQLDLAPVSVTAMLYEVAEDLRDLSRIYDTSISIKVKGSPGQAMAHGLALRAALTSLAYTLLTGGLQTKKPTLTLVAQQDKQGITTGVLSNSAYITSEDLQLARDLQGRAHQPASGITQNSGVGLYIADNLFSAMESPLKILKTGRRSGLAATLVPSQQLALL